jgi:hypothetical protein
METSRLFLVPWSVTIAGLAAGVVGLGLWPRLAAIPCMVASLACDVVDGWSARRLKCVTPGGAALDWSVDVGLAHVAAFLAIGLPANVLLILAQAFFPLHCWRVSGRAVAFVAAIGVAVLGAGCSRPPRPVPVTLERPVYIPDAVAGPVVEVLDEATGFRLGAVTLPGLPPLVFGETADACELEHEAQHQRQQDRDGPRRWSARYASDFLRCWAPTRRREDFVRCYHAVEYERDAFAVQERCMLDRAAATKGPV